eukprot:TCONS_00031935-protein
MSNYIITSPIKEQDGVLGFVNKENKFVDMTNFAPKIVGCVKQDNGVIGCVVQHAPAKIADEKRRNYCSYWTYNDISTQVGIRSRLTSIDPNAHWVAPSPDQYLTTYMQKMFKEYEQNDDHVQVTPIEHYGFQTMINENAIYAFPSKQNDCIFYKVGKDVEIISIEEAHLTKINRMEGRLLMEAPCEVINSLQPIKQLVGYFEGVGQNFAPAIATLAAAALSLHFPTLMRTKTTKGVPLPILLGTPGTAKSSCAHLAMLSVGINNKKFEDCTLKGMLKVLRKIQLPLWWEDVDDFTSIEGVAMNVFNQGEKLTANMSTTCESSPPSALPLVTSNGFLEKSSKIGRTRTIGRSVIIPFEVIAIEGIESVQSLFDFEDGMMAKDNVASNCFGYMLKLGNFITEYKKETNFDLIDKVTKIKNMTMTTELARRLKNYGLLMAIMQKILIDTGRQPDAIERVLTEFFESVEAILPNSDSKSVPMETAKEDFHYIINEALNCEELLPWLRIGKATGCKCKDVLQLNLRHLTDQLGKGGKYNILRQFIHENGCTKNSLKYSVEGLDTRKTCFHVKLSSLDNELLVALKEKLNKSEQKENGKRKDKRALPEEYAQEELDLDDLDDNELLNIDISLADSIGHNPNEGRQHKKSQDGIDFVPTTSDINAAGVKRGVDEETTPSLGPKAKASKDAAGVKRGVDEETTPSLGPKAKASKELAKLKDELSHREDISGKRTRR